VNEVQAPAPRPCESCPYRKDVPSGVWGASEYVKLAMYDRETVEQPMGLFQCHQHDPETSRQVPRVCAGWAGVHGRQLGRFELLSVRMALAMESIDDETALRILGYRSPVPLWNSGLKAMEHGIREISCPSPQAQRITEKIVRLRSDIKFEPPGGLRENG
jgi:hypothetical protein